MMFWQPFLCWYELWRSVLPANKFLESSMQRPGLRTLQSANDGACHPLVGLIPKQKSHSAIHITQPTAMRYPTGPDQADKSWLPELKMGLKCTLDA